MLSSSAYFSQRSLAELLPWLALRNDDIVLCKDGSLLVCFEVTGLDADGIDMEMAGLAANKMEQALKVLDSRFTLWSTMLRQRRQDYADSSFPHPISARLDDLHSERFKAGRQFQNRHVISLLFSPELEDQLLLRIFNALKKMRWVSALRMVLRHLNRSDRFADILHSLKEHIRTLEPLLEAFVGSLGDVQLLRLRGPTLLGFLNQCASLSPNASPLKDGAPHLLLDALLGDAVLEVGAERLRFSRVEGTRHVAALGIKAWPDSTIPGLMDVVLAIPAEVCISQTFRFVSTEAAKGHIQAVQRFHLNLQKSASSFLREAIFGEGNQVQDHTRTVSAGAAREALTDLAQHRQIYGYYNLSIMVCCQHLPDLDPTVRSIAAVVREAGFQVIREGMHLLSAWTGSLPGQWAQLVRWHFTHAGNVADLLPLNTPSAGQSINQYFSEQLGMPCPALSVLPGRDQTAFHFNFHVGDLGHCFVVGPSRAGKSVLVNFLLSQFLRYPGARVLIFDKDRSAKIPTLLQGGRYLDPARDETVFCNPLVALNRKNGRVWLRGWLERLLTHRAYAWSSADDVFLNEALDSIEILPPDHRHLSTLQSLLPQHLAAELAPWVKGGAMGGLFDHAEDRFSLEGLICIEMGELLHNEGVARLFMEYAFERIEALLLSETVAPTVIYIEEAWFMLANPYFRDRIRDWLKTLPKRLASLVMATQSLDDLSGSGVFSAIADNIPTRIFLANRNAVSQSELYRDQFGLNSGHIQRIAYAEPKRQFLVVQPSSSRFIDLSFPPDMIAVLRSDLKAQALFEESRSQGGEDWADRYLARVKAMDHTNQEIIKQEKVKQGPLKQGQIRPQNLNSEAAA